MNKCSRGVAHCYFVLKVQFPRKLCKNFQTLKFWLNLYECHCSVGYKRRFFWRMLVIKPFLVPSDFHSIFFFHFIPYMVRLYLWPGLRVLKRMWRCRYTSHYVTTPFMCYNDLHLSLWDGSTSLFVLRTAGYEHSTQAASLLLMHFPLEFCISAGKNMNIANKNIRKGNGHSVNIHTQKTGWYAFLFTLFYYSSFSILMVQLNV